MEYFPVLVRARARVFVWGINFKLNGCDDDIVEKRKTIWLIKEINEHEMVYFYLKTKR